jgi:putative oxidoreductase
MKKLLALRARLLSAAEMLRPVALLLARLGVGLVFVSTGWGKVHNIAKVTAFFETLHIPAPGLNAVVVGWTELLCGAALVIGLLSRLAAIPLMVSMAVAILTAKLGDVHGLFDFVGLDEFTYIVVLVVIAVIGPGALSVDRVLEKRLIE